MSSFSPASPPANPIHEIQPDLDTSGKLRDELISEIKQRNKTIDRVKSRSSVAFFNFRRNMDSTLRQSHKQRNGAKAPFLR